MESNRVNVVGRLLDDLNASYNTHGDMFFDGTIAVQRQSGTMDYLPIVIPANVSIRNGYDNPLVLRGRTCRVMGVIKTYYRDIGGNRRHFIGLHVARIEEVNDHSTENSVALLGKICKQPIFRETPFGREICDFMVAVDRNYWKSDFIPCIAWGNTARRVSMMEVGQIVELTGRFQSRDYIKKLENGVEETRTAYEVSAKTVCTNEVNKRLITTANEPHQMLNEAFNERKRQLFEVNCLGRF